MLYIMLRNSDVEPRSLYVRESVNRNLLLTAFLFTATSDIPPQIAVKTVALYRGLTAREFKVASSRFEGGGGGGGKKFYISK